jgi:hypothetical protein
MTNFVPERRPRSFSLASPAKTGFARTPVPSVHWRTLGAEGAPNTGKDPAQNAAAHAAGVSAGDDFSRIPVHPPALAHHRSLASIDKSVDGGSDGRSGRVEARAPKADKVKKDAPTKKDATARKKKAGVEFFKVEWTKQPGPTPAKLRLNYLVTFKKDDAHDPALAEFRQNAFHTSEVLDGPHLGQKDDNSPLHDDGYSRASDTAGNTINDVTFVSDDNPGPREDSLDDKDVIVYSFTAEQMIIDTSDGNRVVVKHRPHTATIKGRRGVRQFGGLKTFVWPPER